MQQLIVIEGPTASGKTALAVSLAKQLKTVVISADSRQFYKELAIGTAKPTKEEMDGIPHYFIDSHSISTPVTAAQFEAEAMDLICTKLKDYSKLIVTGGSGMFIDALCIGLDPIPKDEQIQLSLRAELSKTGLDSLLNELQQSDPVYFQEVDRSNPARILRALEVIRIAGRTYSELRKQEPPTRPFEVKRFVIDHPREQLYDRINRRVDNMIDQGLIEEVRNVEAFKKSTTLKTVGYKEVFDYFDGNYSLDACIDKIKQHTRNYAKRQLTWFRKHPDSIWIPFSSTEKMTQDILQVLD
jgi:tRNA dimethylallyltransferase